MWHIDPLLTALTNPANMGGLTQAKAKLVVAAAMGQQWPGKRNDAMCGRFTLKASPVELTDLFGLADLPPVEPRYNIAPTQTVFAVRVNPAGNREPALLKWGLIPSWADDTKIGYRMINARSETAADKPAFRHAFRRKRCLIAADGFYEWQKTGGNTKQPFYIHWRDDKPFAFAGLGLIARSGIR